MAKLMKNSGAESIFFIGLKISLKNSSVILKPDNCMFKDCAAFDVKLGISLSFESEHINSKLIENANKGVANLGNYWWNKFVNDPIR